MRARPPLVQPLQDPRPKLLADTLPAADSPTAAANTAWPNIAAIDGRLLAIGPPEPLPATTAFSLLGGRQRLNGCTARPVGACVATSAVAREWLLRIADEWPEHRLVLVDDELMLLPVA
jgi:hypothetical protein